MEACKRVCSQLHLPLKTRYVWRVSRNTETSITFAYVKNQVCTVTPSKTQRFVHCRCKLSSIHFFSFYYYYEKRWCLSRAGKLKPKYLGARLVFQILPVRAWRWTGREPAPKRILSYGVAKRHRWLHPLDPVSRAPDSGGLVLPDTEAFGSGPNLSLIHIWRCRRRG